ncbi:hypothetical protein SAMN05421790_10232 [Kroppenstedtia eburnea]|uniref:Uncharacterized protein n=1 Tax=Kroppenstedtia eburnea TaxID=714067 RepID=A0A1N7JFJ9_9BACL|nr:hypothetical protein SAMN05421790_10232 [Kroppenstedtia eburnea]
MDGWVLIVFGLLVIHFPVSQVMKSWKHASKILPWLAVGMSGMGFFLCWMGLTEVMELEVPLSFFKSVAPHLISLLLLTVGIGWILKGAREGAIWVLTSGCIALFGGLFLGLWAAEMIPATVLPNTKGLEESLFLSVAIFAFSMGLRLVVSAAVGLMKKDRSFPLWIMAGLYTAVGFFFMVDIWPPAEKAIWTILSVMVLAGAWKAGWWGYQMYKKEYKA